MNKYIVLHDGIHITKIPISVLGTYNEFDIEDIRRGRMNNIAGDNRFEIISKAKQALLESTNIDTSPDEMKVLDNFLFRCWQMGWLDKYEEKDHERRKIITICGIPHYVAETSDHFSSDAAHFGEIDYQRCIITINENMSEEEKKETLCHEILHAILVHLGYDEISQDEKFVQAIANGINQTFTIKE